MSFTDREDDLAATALTLADDIRADREQAWRTLQAMTRLELEQVACVLAAMVDPTVPLAHMAWWRIQPINTTPTRKAA